MMVLGSAVVMAYVVVPPYILAHVTLATQATLARLHHAHMAEHGLKKHPQTMWHIWIQMNVLTEENAAQVHVPVGLGFQGLLVIDVSIGYTGGLNKI
jgi:hypothetical protein